MRNILLIILLVQIQLTFAQNRDSLIKTIYFEKTDSARIKVIYDIIENNGMLDPKKAIYYHTAILEETKKHNDKIGEAVITTELGYTVANISSMAKGTEMIFDALKMAEKTGNQQAIGIAYHNLALNYYFGSDKDKAMQYLQKAYTASKAANNHSFICSETAFFGYIYMHKDKLDSALAFMQKAFELAIKYKVENVLPVIYTGLSDIHIKMGNNRLALEYLKTALDVPYIKLNAGQLADVYEDIARYYRNEGNFDSSLFYGNKAYQVAQNILFVGILDYAGFLKDLYKDRNSDSALKYTNIYYSAKDSVAGSKQMQKLQLLAFEENMRQEKIAIEKEKAETERKHNIQYAGIAIGIISFIILFLLLSRSIIVNTKIIEFLGVTGLLVVFEFINLIMHPYLSLFTNHSPLAMLLVLVVIAMLLVPLHHKLEKWISVKIIEKNKQIRLSAAKRTIAKLEGDIKRDSDGLTTNAQQ